jgi:hypothetical protein
VCVCVCVCIASMRKYGYNLQIITKYIMPPIINYILIDSYRILLMIFAEPLYLSIAKLQFQLVNVFLTRMLIDILVHINK